jgi:hypothetical protein
LVISPDAASLESVVLTVARPSPVAAAISPAVNALPSPSAARTAALVVPGAVRARAGAAAGLAGFCAAGAGGTDAVRVRGSDESRRAGCLRRAHQRPSVSVLLRDRDGLVRSRAR